MSSWDTPFLVCEQTACRPSGPVRVEAVKIVFTLSGWARVHSAQGEVVLDAGSILTIPADVECCGFPAGHARTVTFYVHPEYLADQMRWLPAAHPLVHHLRCTLQDDPGLQTLQLAASTMRELTPALVLAAHAPVGGSDFTMLSTASDVFDAVGRLSGTTCGAVDAAHAMPQREVLAAIALLRANLCRPWRIDDLAREVRMSPSHLGRLFRAQVRISPAAFLRQLRADRMAELLATTSLTIGEAATAVGWTDPAVASRSFKQRYGIPPRVYANTYRTETTASGTLTDQRTG